VGAAVWPTISGSNGIARLRAGHAQGFTLSSEPLRHQSERAATASS
jgi:hypothetical protein